MLNRYLDISTEVKEALEQGKPVVALESTIISHGMPYPQNVETAMNVEKLIRENGAVPATIAIIKGRLKAGLTAEEIDYLGRAGHAVPKASRRDLPVLVAKGSDGACTVTTTMMIAHMAGISVFATGGIGGVHRGAETTMDISADLEELGQTPVMVVCAGAKSILDLGLTLEYLETHGVTVIGYGTDELPAFYCRTSGFKLDYNCKDEETVAKIMKAKWDIGLKGGAVVGNPIPEQYAMDPNYMNGIMSMPATGAIIQSISQTKGGIGYVGLAYLNDNVKAVHVSYDGGKTFTAPSVANAKDGSYPIVRPLYYYYMTHSEKTVKPFVDYILSPAGQQIVREIGFIPVSE